MTLIKNPELQRYTWLEFSAARLIALPALQLIVYFIAYKEGGMQAVLPFAAGFFLILMLGWGTVKVGSSISDEVNDNTWDFQRLSAMSPLELLIGKLLGSAGYVWYGGSIALFFFIVSASATQQIESVVQISLALVLATLLTHAFVLLSSLLSMLGERVTSNKAQTRAHFLVGLIFGSWLIGLLAPVIRDESHAVNWYDISVTQLSFLLTSFAIWLGWLLLAIYMNLKAQLRMRNYPVAWILFLIFIAVYNAGFISSSSLSPSLSMSRPMLVLLHIFGFGLVSSYLMAGIEGRTIVRYRQLLQRACRGQWNWVAALCPRWIVSMLLTGLSFILLLFSGLDATTLLTMSVFVGFVFRDILLFHYVEFSVSTKRVMVTILFYLILLYGVLPMLFRVFDLTLLVDVLQPFTNLEFMDTNGDTQKIVFRVVGAWLQAIIVLTMVYARMKNKISAMTDEDT